MIILEIGITKNLLKKYFVFCSLILFIMAYTISTFKNLIAFDPLVILTFFCIGVLSLINLITSLKYEFSLYKIHGYFFMVFLFLAPLHQYITQSFPWGWNIKEEIIIFGNIIIIIWLLIYLLTYYLTPSSKSPGQLLPQSKKIIIIGFFLTIISTLLTIYHVGSVSNLFARLGSEGADIPQSFSLIISTSTRPFPVIYFSYLYMTLREKNNINQLKGLKVLLILTFLIVLLTNFPTAVSRYHAAAVYMGLILLFFIRKISFDILFLMGIVIIFPTLELFRRSTFEDVFSNFKFQFIELSTGHFDAYSMLMRTIEFLIIKGPSYGFQLLGALFFFIPRSVWPSKPVGSGAYVGKVLGLDFLNISSPFIAEVLINFGFVFFIVGPFLLAIFNKKVDSKYWDYYQPLRYINIYFLFLLAFSFLS